MVGAKYVWVLMGDYSDTWWQTRDSAIDCTQSEFEQGLEGYIATDILPITTSKMETVSGMVCNKQSLASHFRTCLVKVMTC